MVTSDRDAFALIDESTSVLRVINGGVDASPVMTPERLVTLLGVHPAQYRDYAALRGDPSDNLPGVRGVGPRTAARLLAEFGSAAAAFDDLAAVRVRLGAGIAARLAHPDSRPAWELNCRLMAAREEVVLGVTLDGSRGTPGWLPLAAETVEAVYRSFGLPWSAPRAVRVLCGVEPAPVEPQYASVALPEQRPRTGTSARPARRTLPPLPKRRPASTS